MIIVVWPFEASIGRIVQSNAYINKQVATHIFFWTLKRLEMSLHYWQCHAGRIDEFLVTPSLLLIRECACVWTHSFP